MLTLARRLLSLAVKLRLTLMSQPSLITDALKQGRMLMQQLLLLSLQLLLLVPAG